MPATLKPAAITILELYERLRAKDFLSMRNGQNLRSAYAIIKASPENRPAAELLIKNALEIEFPEVFRCYYCGLANKRKRKMSWDRIMYEAMKLFYDGRKIPTMIDFILQNP